MNYTIRPDGKTHSIVGNSRSGKTAYTMAKIRSSKRLLVWDPEGQFAISSGCKSFKTAKDLYLALKGNRGGAKMSLSVDTDLKGEFDLFCEIAFYFGLLNISCTVVEELADVSSAGKAPERWGLLVRRGLKYGMDIYAMSQRIQEVDKTVFGNSSYNVLFRVDEGIDYKKAQEFMGLDAPVDPLFFIEKDKINHTIKNGLIKFKNDEPVLAYKK